MPIGINVDKAKAIQKDKIREVRNPLLQAEDVTFMRAVEEQILLHKQHLPHVSKHFVMLPISLIVLLSLLLMSPVLPMNSRQYGTLMSLEKTL